jgi:hypothetical protein
MIGRVGKGLYNFLQDIGSGTMSTVYVAMNLTTNEAAPLLEPQVAPPALVERVADWYDSDYYSQSPGRNPPGPDSGVGRVLRGGSLHGNQRFTRCAYRVGGNPRYWYFYVRFRCARGSP